ncbi:divergent polysaccharide deacetylase family protein [Kordiimonas marina]|uniref:divergent polysaccharide deacetylase family protein n=1 Tax=Kordiimonas marina TaxID=2872312 RepID=UPI001FF2C57F|nr:divergent polysaccharide deacetylase family protein [Kordiimonas marina]MCJ9427882.1 divergent polysaccharide deacetylase family protein [Kordiimonas marina]
MPTSLNAMLTAWAITIILIFGTIVGIQLAYDPADFKKPDTHHPATANDSHARDAQTGGMQTGHSAADADMPAPGQVTDSADHSFAQLPHIMPVVADQDLLEKSDKGPLPIVAKDGRRPFDVYRSGMRIDPKLPRVAIIISELGQRSQVTRRAIADLPPSVTLAFSPYAGDLINWGERAREAGHEVLLMVPMEPVNYPQNDPGPFTLLTSNSTRDNIDLLEDSMRVLTGYVGIINYMGSRLTAAPDSLRPILMQVKERGLMFVDSRSSQFSQAATMAKAIGIPTAYNNRTIDDNLASDQIAKQLTELENRAQALGSAVGMARPFPVSFEAIKTWAEGLRGRGVQLVPISAVAGMQEPPK